MQLFNLEGKVVVVTGGAGLYGKPITSGLAEAGATVVVASRNLQACEQQADWLRGQGWKAEGMALDQGSETSIREFVSAVTGRLGKIDVLVNNAVSRDGFGDLEEVSREGWEKAQEINATGLVMLTKAVIAGMRERRSGNIINIGSIQGTVGPNFGVYGDTGMSSPVNYTYDKWAMVGFTKWIANYYGRYNIRANCVSPGGYGPGIREDIGDNAFVSNYHRLTPLGRFAEDDDIKGPVIFLAADASAYITGHNLVVDGGWTSW